MSSTMWTVDALASEARSYAAEVWRIVEDQALAATTRLTDSLEDQAILESLLERTKLDLPPEAGGYDFLIATPFRYRPYPDGSRFRRARQIEGVFYASEHVETAAAEIAFLRLLFFAEAPGAQRPTGSVTHTAFSVRVRTRQAIDLMAKPVAADRLTWIHPTDYGPCQELADAARSAGIDMIRYESVRDPEHRPNVAALHLRAITDRQPRNRQSWHVFVRNRTVQAWCESPKLALELPWEAWANDDRIRRMLCIGGR